MYLTSDLMKWADWLNSICILRVMDIHWSYQNWLFWSGVVWHRLSTNHIVRCFKLKKLKSYVRYQVDFLLPLKLQKVSLFWIMPENTLGQSVCRIFYFWLVWLLNLNTGGPLLHCTCSLCYIKIFNDISVIKQVII